MRTSIGGSIFGRYVSNQPASHPLAISSNRTDLSQEVRLSDVSGRSCPSPAFWANPAIVNFTLPFALLTNTSCDQSLLLTCHRARTDPPGGIGSKVPRSSAQRSSRFSPEFSPSPTLRRNSTFGGWPPSHRMTTSGSKYCCTSSWQVANISGGSLDTWADFLRAVRRLRRAVQTDRATPRSNSEVHSSKTKGIPFLRSVSSSLEASRFSERQRATFALYCSPRDKAEKGLHQAGTEDNPTPQNQFCACSKLGKCCTIGSPGRHLASG
mmetsp:Transcript_47244/g.85087  ORF Transcript_47244/g.85087 Transcript_47244/m.85087 type:complete len:267 (+) Transcript_47244:2044-2844(+)